MVSNEQETMLISQGRSSQDTEHTQLSGRGNGHQVQVCMMVRHKMKGGEICAACGPPSNTDKIV